MQAIICSGAGAAEVMRVGEVAAPVPVGDEVLIRVAAAGVNRADLLQREGKYPPPKGASEILGMEVAGEVAEVGPGVKRWKVGDRVCALLGGGGYAEYVAVREGQCLPVPSMLSMREAAALPEAVATVWANVFSGGALKTGQVALVHGGSSGIGTTAIRMVKLFGAKIFVTVGSDEKAEACRQLGADLVINYKKDDFVAAVLGATDGHGVDLVLDMVGGDYVNRNLAALATFGRHVSIATQQGRVAQVDLRFVMQKRLVVTGSTMRGRTDLEKSCILGEIEKKAWPWVVRGEFKPLIHHVYPLKNAAEAHKMMESGGHIGKIVLEA